MVEVTQTSGTAEIATRAPVVSGLTAGTTKQAGRVKNLVAQVGSLTPQREQVGINE